MHTSSKRTGFFGSAESEAIKQELQSMMESGAFNTESSYTANSVLYPDNIRPFVDKHMDYLNNHPKLDAGMYMSNLRLMTRIRRAA